MPSRSPTIGTAAWILEDLQHPGEECCYGTIQTTGWRREDINAYRSELQGIHTLLRVLQRVGQVHGVVSGSVTLYCDNEKAVYLSDKSTILPPALAHIDLINSIHNLRRKLPFRIRFRHIRGHQDSLCPVSSLARPVQLNIYCDDLAKKYLLSLVAANNPHLNPQKPLVGEGPRCYIQGVKLVGNISQRVSKHCSQQLTQSYLCFKGILSPTSFLEVNWNAIGRHLSSQSTPYRLWATKHSYKFAATGGNMVKWGLGHDTACPCCGQISETVEHLYECPSTMMRDCLTESISKFQEWMVTMKTHPDVVAYFTNLVPPTVPNQLPVVRDSIISAASAKQATLGPWNTWAGRLSRSWELIQEDYYAQIGSSRRSSTWAAGMVGQILDIGFHLWSTRNNVLHDKKLGGISLHDTHVLHNSIEHHFSLGIASLHTRDQHLITKRSLQELLRLPATQKRIWLQSIQIAREQGQLQEAVEDNSMAGIMRRWLGRRT